MNLIDLLVSLALFLLVKTQTNKQNTTISSLINLLKNFEYLLHTKHYTMFYLKCLRVPSLSSFFNLGTSHLVMLLNEHMFYQPHQCINASEK